MGRKFSPEVLKVTALSCPPRATPFLMLLGIRSRGSFRHLYEPLAGDECKQEVRAKQNSLMCLSDTLWLSLLWWTENSTSLVRYVCFCRPPSAPPPNAPTHHYRCGENATTLFGITRVLNISLGLKRAVDVVGFHGGPHVSLCTLGYRCHHPAWVASSVEIRKEQNILKPINREGFQSFHLQLKCYVRLWTQDCVLTKWPAILYSILKKSGFGLVQTFYKGKFPFVALVKVELYWLWEESHVAAGLVKVQFLCGWRNPPFLQGEEKKVLFLVPVSPPYGQTGSCSPQMSLRPPPYGPGVLMQMETWRWQEMFDMADSCSRARGDCILKGSSPRVLPELRYECWCWPCSRLTAVQNPAELVGGQRGKHSQEHAQIRMDASPDVKFSPIAAKGGDVTSQMHEQAA